MIDETIITEAIVKEWTSKFLDGLRCDVAVVGGGPSGLTASYYLAKKDFKVCLIEKNLSLGGGIWGGGMFFNKVVVQEEALSILDDLKISYKRFDERHYVIDSIELAGSLIYNISKAGVLVFNSMIVEDLMVKDERVCGLVINWTSSVLSDMHVDPLVLYARAVVDATGHEAVVCRILERKTGKIKIRGEGFMYAEMGERGVVEKACEIFPGLYVTGMAVANVFGLPRMGPIFGGMLLSGKRIAEIISEDLKER